MNEELKLKLISLGLTEEQVGKLADEGVTSESDMQMLSSDEIKTYSGCGAIVGKKVSAAFVSVPKVVSDAPTAVSTATFDVLPAVPTDENWLAALKVGGVLKFSANTVIGTVSAALASRVGLYDLPKKIGELMERHSESLEEPVSEDYFAMQAMLTRRSYAEIFAAMPGVDGRYATDARKAALLRRVDERLWGSLSSFQVQLKAWVDAWQQGQAMAFSNIGALIGAFQGVAVPNLNAPPPADSLRDAADGVVNSINYVFAGAGLPVAMALAYDAQQIRKVLENSSLPAQVGAANREQMLRMLSVAVSSDYPRLERNLKQYALGVIELQNVASGQAELQYLLSLFQLGQMIDWSRLNPTVPSGPVRRGAGIGREDGKL